MLGDLQDSDDPVWTLFFHLVTNTTLKSVTLQPVRRDNSSSGPSMDLYIDTETERIMSARIENVHWLVGLYLKFLGYENAIIHHTSDGEITGFFLGFESVVDQSEIQDRVDCIRYYAASLGFYWMPIRPLLRHRFINEVYASLTIASQKSKRDA